MYIQYYTECLRKELYNFESLFKFIQETCAVL
jgi:hypothetical protein